MRIPIARFETDRGSIAAVFRVVRRIELFNVILLQDLAREQFVPLFVGL